jgi:tyrosine phenol-lyase
MSRSTVAEPFRNKVIERLPVVPYQRRRAALIEAGHNPWLIRSIDVPIDFLTDSGPSAQSDRQWAGLMMGDEAYAGSRNFYVLEKNCQEIFGHRWMVPTHLGRGAEHLVCRALIPDPSRPVRILAQNPAPTARAHWHRRGASVVEIGGAAALDPKSNEIFRADVDLDLLQRALSDKSVPIAFVSLACCPDFIGAPPARLANLKEAARLAREAKVPVVLDASRIAQNALLVQRHEAGQDRRTLREIIRDLAGCGDILVVSAKEACLANCGGFVCTQKEAVYEAVRSLVVVFEGLHTYGGMAGRDMEAVATGLMEMTQPEFLGWHQYQLEYLAQALESAGLPVVKPVGGAGVYLDARRFAAHLPPEQYPALAVACAIYLGAGVRCGERGLASRARLDDAAGRAGMELVALCPAMRVYSLAHLQYVAKAIAGVWAKRDFIRGLRLRQASGVLSGYGATFDPVEADCVLPVPLPDPQAQPLEYEPYRTKTVEVLRTTDREYRERAVAEAGFNTFLLKSEDCYIDLLTDSGTSAMSDDQWAAAMMGDESAAGARDFYQLEEAQREVLGFAYMVPVHQGRAGEHLISQAMIKPGDTIPGNMYFTTTREHQELAGGTFVDVIIDQAHDPASQYPWKGDIDLNKLRALIEKVGAKRIPYIKYECSVNMAGGQPVSMENARAVSELCHSHGIHVMFDATRCAENAYLIQKKDPKYHKVPVAQILKELMSYGDGCTISAKKDLLVNIGSFCATNHRWVYERVREMCPVFEGPLTSGGMTGRDMACLAAGIYEMIDDSYIRSRVEATQYLGRLLLDAGIPIVEPPGTHAIFLDARRFLPHIDQDQYPAQALAAELFIEGGIRAMERGNVSAGRDKKTGQNKRPKLELVRLTIPRRVYSRTQFELCAEAVIRVWKRRESIRGLKMVFEAPQLRFFTARFERV